MKTCFYYRKLNRCVAVLSGRLSRVKRHQAAPVPRNYLLATSANCNREGYTPPLLNSGLPSFLRGWLSGYIQRVGLI